MPTKAGIKFCRFGRVSLICACMDVPTQLELCLYDQTHVVAHAAYRVGSQQFLSYTVRRYLACYLFP